MPCLSPICISSLSLSLSPAFLHVRMTLLEFIVLMVMQSECNRNMSFQQVLFTFCTLAVGSVRYAFI